MGSTHEQVAIPRYVAPIIMSSQPHQPCNLGENTSNKFPNNGKFSKPKVHQELEMHSEDAGNDKVGNSFPVSLGINRRPWPSRKVSEAEEMVKYMSSIPNYLQSEEKGYNIQEKALNVGVLDWRRLQKWTDHEKLVANKIDHDSSSSSNSSSLLSTFRSSPYSSRSNVSPPTERKQTSAISNTSNLTSSEEKDKKKGSRKDSSTVIIKSQDAGIGCLPSDSVGSENFALLSSNLNTKVARLDELKKVQISIEQESSKPHLNQDGDGPKSKQLVAKDRRKHLEEIIARSMLSFDAALFDHGSLRKKSSSKVSGTFSLPPRSSAPSSNTHRDEPQEACIPTSKPHTSDKFNQPSLNSSSPFRSSTNHTMQDANKNASFEKGRELLPIVLPRVDLKGISGSPLKAISDNPNEAVGRSSSRGKRSPMRQFFDLPRKSTSSAGSISDNPDVAGARSSSRSKRSPPKQMLDQPLNSSNPDVPGSRSSSRGRRSPLRQMFESPRKSSSSVNASQKPQDSCGIVEPPPTEDSLSDPMHSPSTRQALLKLCWKNGMPLLLFSSSDDSILVAMMHKRGNSDMNICDCVYEINTAMSVEVKKKNGAWLSQGTKSKKPEFTCKFVAELIVSSSERVSFDLSHRSFIRELVLLGDELVPSNHVDATNTSSTELAAIVVESSDHKSGSPSCGILCECNLCIPRIAAILPSGVHGFSNTREPSKLIERWESGGTCDCGGWDEGCTLTILTNNSKEMNNSKLAEDCGAIHGTCGFDLFTEGDARKGKPSFSMVAFKEDMFTVEFKASIPLLQAFAISISMMHDRNPGDRVMGNHSVEIHNYDDLSFDNYQRTSS